MSRLPSALPGSGQREQVGYPCVRTRLTYMEAFWQRWDAVWHVQQAGGMQASSNLLLLLTLSPSPPQSPSHQRTPGVGVH